MWKAYRILANVLAFAGVERWVGGWHSTQTWHQFSQMPTGKNWATKKLHYTTTHFPQTWVRGHTETHAQAVLLEKDVACSNGRTRITTNEKNKYSNHESGHETGSAGQPHSLELFWLTGSCLLWPWTGSPKPSLKWKNATLCWRAPRSQLPLCRSHDDGTCAAKNFSMATKSIPCWGGKTGGY